MKLLADTNILIDRLVGRGPFSADVERLCIACYFGDISLWATVQSYLDALYVLRRHAAQAELRRACIACLDFFRPCGTRGADLLPALQSEWPDIEDFIIAKSAENLAADYLLMRGATGFAESKTPCITCAEALVLLKEQGIDYDDLELA